MTKRQFLMLATLFEGSLVLIGMALAEWFGIRPESLLKPDLMTVPLALGGTLPLIGFLVISDRCRPLRDLSRDLVQRLGQLIASLDRAERLYLGFLAGVTEEYLFRGVLQPGMEAMWGYAAGLLLSNLLFGLLHWITPLYAGVAGILGIYLGWTLDLGPERNLMIPILVHALYDVLALEAIGQRWRALEFSKSGYPQGS